MFDIHEAEQEVGLRELFYKHRKLLKELRDIIKYDSKVECQDKLLLEIALDSCNKDYITDNCEIFKIFLQCYKNRVMKMTDNHHILTYVNEEQYYELLTFACEIRELYYDDSWMY